MNRDFPEPEPPEIAITLVSRLIIGKQDSFRQDYQRSEKMPAIMLDLAQIIAISPVKPDHVVEFFGGGGELIAD
ncbi:hypothetical protein MACH26_08960 [Planctobacterium marinum]|uniref:Uncharacterized protein n=1 Tax=Planctobacterium marinum TaxID=1631968 RepID=A0AA48KTH0_9ALTE|nr:hypothetical protein MACH26_08960 [Planctobacterium marinum]